MVSGDLVAGILKGLAQGASVIFGMGEARKEAHDTVNGSSLSDDEFAAAQRLHARAASRAQGRSGK